MQLWEDSHGEAHPITHENWDYLKRESFRYFLTINCIHFPTHGMHILFQVVFYD